MQQPRKQYHYTYGTDADAEETEKFLNLHQTTDEPKFQMPTSLIVGSVLLTVMGLGVFLSASHNASSDLLTKSSHPTLATFKQFRTQATEDAGSSLEFTLKRRSYNAPQYFKSSYKKYMRYVALEDYDAIIEPYQSMELHFYDSSSSSSAEYNYDFVVCPEGESSEASCQVGYQHSDGSDQTTSKSVSFSCSPWTAYSLSLAQSRVSDGVVTATKTLRAVCLYVRRELRDLTEADRDAYLDAAVKLSEVDTTEGKAKYGSSYRSLHDLVRMHHFNAAQQDQDHIHEGNGFMMQHLKITNYYDEAIRAVNPAVTLPYWDFTIDHAQNRTSGVAASISSREYFGKTNTPQFISKAYSYTNDSVEDGRILNGRWKDLKADMNDFTAADMQYGYGYLRAPWNMNPSPYISRFAFDFDGAIAFPSCTNHYDILQYTDMMDYFFTSAFAPHATTHTLMGGFFGCDALLDLVSVGAINSEDDSIAVCASWSFFLKEIWRSAYITVPSSCEVNTEDYSQSSCPFTCSSDTEDYVGFFAMTFFSDYVDKTSTTAQSAWSKFMCGGKGSRIFTGDHLESASPADPSFWPIHTTLERLFHAKLMAGGFDSETWATDNINDYVCNRPSCYNSTTQVSDYYSECCYGHYEHDQMYDGDAADRSVKTGYTNAEVLAMSDPRSKDYSMPYVYDGFSWSHCSEDFASLLDDLYSSRMAAKKQGKKESRAPTALQLQARQQRKAKVQMILNMPGARA